MDSDPPVEVCAMVDAPGDVDEALPGLGTVAATVFRPDMPGGWFGGVGDRE